MDAVTTCSKEELIYFAAAKDAGIFPDQMASEVLRSCQWVTSLDSCSCTINSQGIKDCIWTTVDRNTHANGAKHRAARAGVQKLVNSLDEQTLQDIVSPKAFDQGWYAFEALLAGCVGIDGY